MGSNRTRLGQDLGLKARRGAPTIRDKGIKAAAASTSQTNSRGLHASLPKNNFQKHMKTSLDQEAGPTQFSCF